MGLDAGTTAALTTAGGAAALWAGQRYVELRTQRALRTALYVNPLVFAAHDLQSRLFNVLDRDGLRPLHARYPDGAFAEQTLYLVACYFAYEGILLRFTPFGADREVIRCCRRVRGAFSTDRDGADPWCLFRSGQSTLGQAVLTWTQGEHGFPDTRPLVEFRAWLDRPQVRGDLHVVAGLDALRAARTPADLPARTRQRMAEVQAALVELLDAVERKVRRWPRFTVALEPRLTSVHRGDRGAGGGGGGDADSPVRQPAEDQP